MSGPPAEFLEWIREQRTLKLDAEIVRTLEAVGMADGAQADLDIDQVVAGTLSLAGLLEICQRGAEDDATLAAWSDYAAEIVRIADSEMLRQQTIAALSSRAVNATTRQIAECGIVLTHAEADKLGADGIDWIRTRLGMTVRETDRGVECRRG